MNPIDQPRKTTMRPVHNQDGEGTVDTIIGLLVIVVGIYLTVVVISLVVRILVLVAVGVAVVYLVSKLFNGVGEP